MRILITGANGFVGARLVADFAARGHHVRAAARRNPGFLPTGAIWVRAPDLGATADWFNAIDDSDIVVHAAARVHVMNETSSDPLREFRRANVAGTLALAEQAAAAGVRRFLFLSSIKVNGEETASNCPFRADDPPRPIDPYAVSKADAERLLFALGAKTGMAIVVIRPALVYGPGVGANFHALLAAIARGLPLPLGAVDNRRSMVFVGNLADLTIRAAESEAADGHVFLVSDGEDLSTPALLRRLGEALGRPARLLHVPPTLIRAAAMILGKRMVARRVLGSLQVDIESTMGTLNWTPPFSVGSGLAETASAYRKLNRT